MTEQLAIIKGIHVGVRDAGRPILWFESYVSESGAALQVLEWDAAGEMLKAAGVYRLEDLEGKPCRVDVTPSRVTYLRPWGG